MRTIAAILIAITLMFSAGSAWADYDDDTGSANKLFVEAVKLVKSVENVEGLEEKAAALEEALAKLNEIVDDYPRADVAVKLISGQRIGALSLEGVREVAERAREKAERAAEEAREFEKTLKDAEQGDAEAQYKVGSMYYRGKSVPKNYAEAIKWWRKDTEKGDAET